MKNEDITSLSEFRAFAEEIAIAAGRITLQYFKKDILIEYKADRSPVTAADREAEQLIRDRIKEQYPEHTIIGEEYGREETGASVSWFIDPIDGTDSFIRGIPLYTVLVAVIINGQPKIGVIHCPPQGETVSAAEGMGCTQNGKTCSVSKTKNLSEASIQVTDYAELNRRQPKFTGQLLKSSGNCRTWADAYGYLLVASGRADAMIDPIMNIWDIAPLYTIITEAGGTFTDLMGKPEPLGTSALASNGILHKQLLDLHMGV
jgi:histidinol phosphatase-like enzyme (inositol monophosphatase family)